MATKPTITTKQDPQRTPRIFPTVGRVVWYWPSAEETKRRFMSDKHMRQEDVGGPQPFAAQIVYVLNNRTVNLSVTDHHGRVHARHDVQLVQDGEEAPKGAYCRWMPYQVGQAAKTEAAEKAAAVAKTVAPAKTAPTKAVKTVKKAS